MSLDYKLLFLAGPTAGRELLIPAGELRLGGEDADIDMPLAHGGTAVLHISESGVRIDAGAPVWIDGRPHADEAPVAFGKIVDIDGVILMFGTATMPLAIQSVPRRLHAAQGSSGKNAALFTAAGVCLLLLAIAAFALLRGAPTTAPSSAYARPAHAAEVTDGASDRELIDGLIVPLGLSGLRFERDAAGTVLLSGNCAASAQLQALKEALRQRDLRTRDELMCDDQLRRQIDAVLSMNGYAGTEVRFGATPGSVLLRGDFKADAQWERTELQLRRLAHIRSLTAINDDAEHFQALLTRLGQQDLLPGLSMRISGQRIVVNGQLPAIRQAAVQRALHAFNQRSGSRLQAAFENIPLTRPLASILPAPIESLSGDSGAPLLRLTNGMSLAEGAILPGGFTIFTLRPDGVTVLRQQELIYLPLGLANS